MDMKTNRGFTLIELMITLVVAAILLTVAIPSFFSVIQNNRLTTATNAFITAMTLARSEAVKRGADVMVDTIDSSDGSNEWGRGFRVGIDGDGDGAIAAGEALQTWPAFEGGITLDSDGDIASFTYDANGVVDSGDTLDLCDSQRSGETGREITIANTGRVSVTDRSLNCS